MKRIQNKKFLFIFFILIIVCLTSSKLVKYANRAIISNSISYETKKEIYNKTKGMSENEIVNYSMSKTCELLSFSKNNNIKEGKANCTGYAQLCAQICNYSFKINKYKNCYALPVVGYIKCFGVNICDITKNIVPSKWKNFVKDHDFVEVHINQKTFLIDPSIYDYTGNSLKTSNP